MNTLLIIIAAMYALSFVLTVIYATLNYIRNKQNES
jgi:hypothetical protein